MMAMKRYNYPKYILQIPGFVSLNVALQNAFVVSNNLNLILASSYFDSHSRNISGMPDALTGKAVVLIFRTITELEQHVANLAASLSVTLFEIVPVMFDVSIAHVSFQTEQSREATHVKKRKDSDEKRAQLKKAKKSKVPKCTESSVVRPQATSTLTMH